MCAHCWSRFVCQRWSYIVEATAASLWRRDAIWVHISQEHATSNCRERITGGGLARPIVFSTRSAILLNSGMPRSLNFDRLSTPSCVYDHLDHSPRLKPGDSWADHRSPSELGASYTVLSWPEATSTRVPSRRPCGRAYVSHTWSFGVRWSGAPDGARRFLPMAQARGLHAARADKKQELMCSKTHDFGVSGGADGGIRSCEFVHVHGSPLRRLNSAYSMTLRS